MNASYPTVVAFAVVKNLRVLCACINFSQLSLFLLMEKTNEIESQLIFQLGAILMKNLLRVGDQ
jgi:hypothetical protein